MPHTALKISQYLFAGQITGVEGYVESASSGMVAGINAAMDFLGKDRVVFPKSTAIGAWVIMFPTAV